VVVPGTGKTATGVITSTKVVGGQVSGSGQGGAVIVNTGKPLSVDVASSLVFPELCEIASADGLGLSPSLEEIP